MQQMVTVVILFVFVCVCVCVCVCVSDHTFSDIAHPYYNDDRNKLHVVFYKRMFS